MKSGFLFSAQQIEKQVLRFVGFKQINKSGKVPQYTDKSAVLFPLQHYGLLIKMASVFVMPCQNVSHRSTNVLTCLRRF